MGTLDVNLIIKICSFIILIHIEAKCINNISVLQIFLDTNYKYGATRLQSNVITRLKCTNGIITHDFKTSQNRPEQFYETFYQTLQFNSEHF